MKKIVLAFMLFATATVSAKVIGTVNGYSISEKEANAFLKIATKGKVTYRRLKRKDKKALVERLAIDKLVLKTALKEISKKEQENIIAGFWLRKKAAKYKVKNSELKSAYRKNKKFFKNKKGKIVPFAEVKSMIKTSIAQKKAVNAMMENATIKMNGKVISSPKTRKKSSKKFTGNTAEYIVKSGNTLSGIANRYGMSSKELRKLNGMSSKAVLKIGQKLKVPAKNKKASKSQANIYVVKSGNTLSGIANKYGMSSKELRAMNDMDSKAVLKIGQKLKVPSK